jgi:hypothetical protein
VIESAPDPCILAANLTALSRRQPDVAKRLEDCAPDADALAVIGRDGSFTFRVQPDQHWLGHSSMPTVSATALTEAFNAGPGNVLLPGLGHGQEAKLLLDKLPAHRAVYTWEQHLIETALALRLLDFSRDIAAGRLVICVGDRPGIALQRAFERFPRHLPPAAIFVPPYLEPETIQILRTEVEEVATARHRALVAELNECVVRMEHAEPGDDLAILSLVASDGLAEYADRLKSAAEQQGLRCRSAVATGPDAVHPLTLAEVLADAAPQKLIWLNQHAESVGSFFSTQQPGTSWFFNPTLRPVASHDDRPWFVTGPEWSGRSAPTDRAPGILPPTPRFEEIRATPEIDVALVAQRGPQSAADLGLQWDSHQRVFEYVTDHLSQRPRRLSQDTASRLFEQACRHARFKLDVGEIRTRWVHTIRALMGPAATARQIIPALVAEGLTVRLYGTGWEHVPEIQGTENKPFPSNCTQRQQIIAEASLVIIIENDEWTDQHLIDAIGSGATVLWQRSDGDERREEMAELFKVIPSFEFRADALEMARQLLSVTGSSRMDQARKLIASEFSSTRRLNALLRSCDDVPYQTDDTQTSNPSFHS